MNKTLIVCYLISLGVIQTVSAQSSKTGLKIATFDINATHSSDNNPTYALRNDSTDLFLRAKGLILIGAGNPIVLCAIDWNGIANESQDAFKGSLAEAAGTLPNRVVVHTVHHYGAPVSDFTTEKILIENESPVGCFDGIRDRELIQNIQKSISTSLSNTQPITDIGIGKASIYKTNSNRRGGKQKEKTFSTHDVIPHDSALGDTSGKLIDPEISLLSFWQDDKALTVLSFYAVSPQNYHLKKTENPDFPDITHFMRHLTVSDALHIHFNGALENIVVDSDSIYEPCLIRGERMADGIKHAWENTQKNKITAEGVQWITKSLFLPYNSSKVENIGKFNKQDIFEILLPDKSKLTETATNISKGESQQILIENMQQLGWCKRRMEGKSIEIACLVINNARILFMPGEPSIEYQLAAKSMAPKKFIAMAAYGDYGPSFIRTKEVYQKDGDAIRSSLLAADSEEYLKNTIYKILKEADNYYNGLLKFSNNKSDCQIISTKEQWKKRKKQILKNMEEIMGDLSTTYSDMPDLQYTDSLKNKNYIRYSINFQATPSERVYAYLYKPIEYKKKYPAILALHSTGAEGKRIIDDATHRRNRGYAKELAERGYVVISPDYPGFGESRNYDFNNDSYLSGTMKGVFNHITCVNILESIDYVDTDRIGVIGHSLGGHNAIFVAAFDPRLKVVVSSSGWTLMDYYNAGERLTKLFGGRLGAWAQDRYMPLIRTKYNLDPELIPVDFDEIIASISPRPFFSNSPIFDYFSVEGVRKGSERIQEVYDFMNASDKFITVYPACGHDFPEEVRLKSYNFIDSFLMNKEIPQN